MPLSRQQLYDGGDAPAAERRLLRAGPLTLVYEAGDLRMVRLGEREVLRRVYAAVRDRNWGTVPATITDERLTVGAESFEISYESAAVQGPIDVAWRTTIAGAPDGTVSFAIDGAARTTFLRNRIGLCALHPVRECAGAPCVVERADGARERLRFPLRIGWRNLLPELRAISYPVTDDVTAELRFEGDLFEVKDQRNWIDASFKTFCTPLRLPYPVEIAAGTPIAQSLTLRLVRRRAPVMQGWSAATPDDAVAIRVGQEPAGALPALGLGLASHGEPLAAQEIARLRALGPAHLRLDLRLADPRWRAALARGVDEAGTLGAQLEVGLFLRAADDLRQLRDTLADRPPPICRWLVFRDDGLVPDAPLALAARAALHELTPAARFAAGTDAYFAQLNAAPPAPDGLNALCFSINPQVHAFDNASLAENAAAVADTVASARALGGLPVVVSPVTLRWRWNPDATGPAAPTPPDALPPQVDARQMSLFGAAWTLACLKYLAESGAASATFYETTGWRGVMAAERGPRLPARFPAPPGAVFPLYHVLADACGLAGGALLPAASSDTLRVEALALATPGGATVLLANLTAQHQPVRISSVGPRAALRLLDETSAERAMRDPETFRQEAATTLAADAGGELRLVLPPYATARLDTAV